MANTPLVLTRAEFREWFEDFGAFVKNKAYERLEYNKWSPLNIWSRKDSDWKEIVIDWTVDGDTIWIYPYDEIKLSPNSVIVSARDLSFGRFLWDMIVDYYDNLEISMRTAGESAKCAAETISNGIIMYNDLLNEWKYEDSITPNNICCSPATVGEIQIDDNTHLSDCIKNFVEEINNNYNKESNEMMKFDFGPVDSSVRMSMYGMAIKNASGTYVAYDENSKSIVDVDILNFEGASKFIYKLPVALKEVRSGDVIIHARKPMFVLATYTDGRFKVLDVFDGEEKTIVPARSPFGFDYMTKVVSFVNFTNADNANPFGNLLPLMLLSDTNGKDNSNLMLAMAMSSNMFGNIGANPLMVYALMSEKGNQDVNPLMLLALSGGFGAQPNGCSGNCSCHKNDTNK